MEPESIAGQALYDEDEATVLRKSHENPLVQRVYEEFLGQPGSEKPTIFCIPVTWNGIMNINPARAVQKRSQKS